MSDSAAPKRFRLQRLAEALRARDWLGLVFEILVVTLGVLLAFEIEQWGDRRQRAAEERQFLERLYNEYQRGIDELDVAYRNHQRIMRNFRMAFAARRDPVRLRQYASTVNMGCDAGYLRTTPFNNTAFEELINSGRLNIISNPELRTRIRDLTTERSSLRDRANAGTEAAQARLETVKPYYRFELLPDGTTRCFTDWPRLFDDQRAVSDAAFIYRMHELVSRGRADLRRMTEKVRAEIGCKLGKPECRRG